MRKINKKSIPIKSVANHSFIEDLQFYEGPLVSLYRTERDNWIYVWCDSEKKQANNRWLVIKASRANLVSYLQKTKTLRTLIADASERFLLDHHIYGEYDGLEYKVNSTFRHLYKIDSLNEVVDYLPGETSYFKESLAENINPEVDFVPQDFSVPIAGNWFCHDFDKFTGLYSQLYAFFYCTTPQFISNLSLKVESLLHSPWKGGFSRVNLFEALKRYIPAVHDLEVKKIVFNSPGEIVFEAIPLVNNKIKLAILFLLNNHDRVVEIEKFFNQALSENNLKRCNVSALSDETLNLPEVFKNALRDKIAEAGDVLGISDELKSLTSNSPNVVISAKITLSVLVRIRKITSFEILGQLDLEEKQPRPYRD